MFSFQIPNAVSRQTDGIDRGFLSSLLPGLKKEKALKAQQGFFARLAGKESDLKKISQVCFDFASSHSHALMYHPCLRGEWKISNYALANLRFYPSVNGFEWQIYSVGSAGWVTDNGNFQQRDLQPERDLRVIPYLMGDNLKAILIAERYEFNPRKFDIRLLVGDNFQPSGLTPMPDFIT
jgi:hypothetical protein